MHRDKKLGLALGVLLVGMVAAFFYRNDRAAEPKAPRLENPQSLDDRIAERRHVPYLSGVESDDVVRNTSHGQSSTRRNAGTSDLEPDLGRPMPFGQETRGAADVPDPIPAFSETRIPASNREWTPLKPEHVARSAKPEPPPASADAIVHEVRPGDTLSGIAAKYLGSSARFNEIYQANRDQLRSANDVRSGMKLRIPRKTEATASDRNPSRPRTSSEERTPPARDRRADRDPLDRSGASLLPLDPDRDTADRGTSRNSIPMRSISSRPPEETEDVPFGMSDDSRPLGAETAGKDDFRDDRETSHGSPFRPSRRPLMSGSQDPPAERATGGQRLGQRLPEDLPDLEDAGSRPRSQPFSEKPKPRGTAEPARQSASEFLKDADGEGTRTAKGTASRPDLAPGRYLVQRGDTLEKIAQRLLGDKSAAPRILDANRDILRSIDDVREGMSLRIPR